MANETKPVETNTTTETETTTAPVKQPRKPRDKVRSIDALTAPGVSVKTMSDREKALLIEHYKAENNKLVQQVEAYRHNAEEAFKKAQLFENASNSVLDNVNAKFNDIIQAVSVLYKTVYLIAKDGANND